MFPTVKIVLATVVNECYQEWTMTNSLLPRVRFLTPVARRLQLRRAWSDELRRLAKLAGLYPKSVR